jgi:methionyl-tRNA formyltransferase
MKVVFFGTPDFAVPTLDALCDAGHDLRLVVAQPDAPAGRGQALRAPPVALRARERGLPLLQPTAVRTAAFAQAIADADADIGVVIAYGRILTPAVLAAPRRGCVNVHASLLPRWRGAAPIAAALRAGDAETGVCTQQMVAELDAGDILLAVQVPIARDETAGSLHDRLAALSARVAVDTLDQLATLRPLPQDPAAVTWAPKIGKDDGRVDFTEPAEALDRRVRAMTPWPGGWTAWGGEALKLRAVEPVAGAGVPGTVLSTQPLVVACGAGALLLREVQAPGKKPVSGADFANGARLRVGAPLSPPESP